MIYSDSNDFLFISVPKTASTSIQHELMKLQGAVKNHLVISGIDTRVSDHVTASYLKDYFGDRWDSLYKVAFVRNPWDRFYSAYYYNKQGLVKRYSKSESKPPYYRSKILLSRIIPFAVWSLFYPFKPASHFICDSKGQVLVDKVYTFENIETAFNMLCLDLGLASGSLETRNKSEKGKTYLEGVGSFAGRVIAHRHKLDLQNFKYTFNASNIKEVAWTRG